MNKSAIKYGWIYYPRFSLSVNNEQIAALSGNVKLNDKKGIMQYDVNLRFETKRFQTELAGSITRRELSLSTNLKADYKFMDGPTQTIEFEADLNNRGQKFRSDVNGAVKWKSTAYPKYNFAGDFTFVSLSGHVDLQININNAVDFVDPNYTLGIRLVLVQSNPENPNNEESHTTAFIEVKRKISNIDCKFMVK